MKNRLIPDIVTYTVQATKPDGSVVTKLINNDSSITLKYLEELYEDKKDNFRDMDFYSVLNISYNELQEIERLLELERKESF